MVTVRHLSIFVVEDTATPDVYTNCPTHALHAALPISPQLRGGIRRAGCETGAGGAVIWRFPIGIFDMGDAHAFFHSIKYTYARYRRGTTKRSEEHTSELQSLMRISYAVFCLKKKTIKNQ